MPLGRWKTRNQLQQELRHLKRYHRLVIDEVGDLPLERQAANLLFALDARRYERGSIAVTAGQRRPRSDAPWPIARALHLG